MALQQDHAHAAGAASHAALLSGGHRGPDGVVQGELARRGEKSKGAVCLRASDFVALCAVFGQIRRWEK